MRPGGFLGRSSVYGRRATVTFAEAALSYQENGGNKRFLDKVIRHFGTTPLGKIDQDAIDQGARKVYPNASAATCKSNQTNGFLAPSQKHSKFINTRADGIVSPTHIRKRSMPRELIACYRAATALSKRL